MLKRDLNSELIKRLKDNEVLKNKLIPESRAINSHKIRDYTGRQRQELRY